VVSREDQLQSALMMVEAIQDNLLEILLDAADAKAELDTQYSKAFLEADGTEKVREAKAKLATERFKRDLLQKEAIREFQRGKLKSAQDAVSARQTLVSAEKRTNGAF
jgi:hypothetical protein